MKDLVLRPLRAFVLTVVLVLGSAFLPLGGIAFATHGTCEIDVTPEAQTATAGATTTFTIALRQSGTDVDAPSTEECTTRDGGTVDISVEITTGDASPNYSPGSIDAADTPLQPDLGCSITNGQNSCTVQYTRNSPAGTDTVEAFAADEPADGDSATQTWTGAAVAFLNATPESDINPVQTSHVVTATATTSTGQPASGVNVDFEITGGPNANLDNTKADRECTTNANGVCTVTYTDGATNPAAPNNVDTICSWVDTGDDDVYNPFGTNQADGGDCDVESPTETDDSSLGGTDAFGNDLTDVVQKTWGSATLTMTPASDSGSVGTCNAFTITLTDGAGAGDAGETIDVEQIHALATNNTADDEPTVDFCTPDAADGANPSAVNTNAGDLKETGQGGDNPGTSGGETAATTDNQGRITIGITSAPGNGSDGTGTVTVTAFLDSDGDDDPDASEPTDTSTKTWVLAEPRVLDCGPETASPEVGSQHAITCVVVDRFGDPVAGEGVTVTTSGVGSVGSTTLTTDAAGTVTITASSFQLGAQNVTATLDDDLTGAEPGEVDECDRAANDPGGAPAGTCSDEVTATWVAPTTGSPVPQICLDTPGAFIGSDGDDSIAGTDGDDVICARGGDDTVVGRPGDDRILGGPGNDNLRGGGGADVITAGGGSDIVRGGRGPDVLKGGGGNDDLRGGRGHDLINGGPGTDTCRGGRGRDRIRRCER